MSEHPIPCGYCGHPYYHTFGEICPTTKKEVDNVPYGYWTEEEIDDINNEAKELHKGLHK